MIQIEHLNKTYVSRQGETHIALTDINLTIEDGSVFGIIGQSVWQVDPRTLPQSA